MEKKIPLRLSVLLILLSILITFMATFVGVRDWAKKETMSQIGDGSSDSYLGTLNEVKKLFDDHYIGEIDEEQLSDYINYGFVAGTGDKYAHYYNAEDFASLQEDLKGEMQGIGVSVIYNAEFQAIEVINVFPNSPALDAGVEVGDLIMYVGDDLESVASLGYNLAVKKVQGEAGTIAKFVVFRGENHNEQVTFEIPRAHIAEQTVTWRIYEPDNSVGVIKISSFDTGTVEQFKEALESLMSAGAEKIVFDVRNNPGGELKSICSILDILLPEGPIIRTIDNKGNESVAATSGKEELDVPMAVVVNSNTASAAELFSSALKDYKKAKVVGTVTYGKGCMQTMYPLSNGGCLSLTTALYCPPFSENYDGVGVKPDIEAELSGEAAEKNLYKLTDEEDSQLAAAVASFAK